MSAPAGPVPTAVDTETQPPMTLPLRHFLVGLGLLVLAGAFGLAATIGGLAGRPDLAHLHLLLAGWVCVTIMGAMTQFVPVWSGVALHSRRLAALQLPLVAGGVVGFALALAVGREAVVALPVFGAVMLAGFWTFAYTLGRTLAAARPLDATERHFAVALGWFVLVTVAGLVLAFDLARPVLPAWLPRHRLVATHATMAVFGAVLTTIQGALFQLVDLFAPAEASPWDRRLQAVEGVAYPAGVLVLASGRLLARPDVARLGAVLVLLGLTLLLAFLARRLVLTWGAWTPMLARYAVAAVALAGWLGLTTPAWLAAPTAFGATLGAPGQGRLLLFAVVGFVVLGTLYHVVPFIVWLHRYADRLGYERVPVVDDLYDDGLAVVDLAVWLLGGALLLAGSIRGMGGVGSLLTLLGGTLLTVGAVLAAATLFLVVRRHGSQSLGAVLFGERLWAIDGGHAADDGETRQT